VWSVNALPRERAKERICALRLGVSSFGVRPASGIVETCDPLGEVDGEVEIVEQIDETGLCARRERRRAWSSMRLADAEAAGEGWLAKGGNIYI
jgi:hypothetical protein